MCIRDRPNLFGTDEFMKWGKKADTACMMAVNLGLRGVDDARNLVEMCIRDRLYQEHP